MHGNELHFWVHSAGIFASPSECHFTTCKTDGSIDLPSGLLRYLKYLRDIRAQILKWCKCRRHQPFEKVYINTSYNIQILKNNPAHRKGEILRTLDRQFSHGSYTLSHKWLVFTLDFKYAL